VKTAQKFDEKQDLSAFFSGPHLVAAGMLPRPTGL
jgi:hypothetical protein